MQASPKEVQDTRKEAQLLAAFKRPGFASGFRVCQHRDATGTLGICVVPPPQYRAIKIESFFGCGIFEEDHILTWFNCSFEASDDEEIQLGTSHVRIPIP